MNHILFRCNQLQCSPALQGTLQHFMALKLVQLPICCRVLQVMPLNSISKEKGALVPSFIFSSAFCCFVLHLFQTAFCNKMSDCLVYTKSRGISIYQLVYLCVFFKQLLAVVHRFCRLLSMSQNVTKSFLIIKLYFKMVGFFLVF